MAKAAEYGDTQIGVTQLAAMLRKSPQWIAQLTRDGVLQKGAKGKYHLADTIEAYIGHVTGASEEKSGPKKSDFDREIAEIKRDKARIELEELRGNVHFAEDVQRVMADIIVTAKTKLLAIPSRVAPKAANEPSPVVQQLIEAEIFAALEALAAYDPAIFREKAGGDGDPDEDPEPI